MKKIAAVIGVCFCIVLAWYIFVRSFEFSVNFTAKTIPGDIIQSLRIWNKSLPNAIIEKVDSFNSVHQNIEWNSRSYKFTWTFDQVNDSSTNVGVLVSEPGRSLTNKLLVPFTTQPVEQDAEEIARTFYAVLKEHLNITAVKLAGEANTPESFCVCRSLETLQTEKAYGMMKDYDILTSFVSTFNLKPDGPPFVKVSRWSHTANSLEFDFCFPIVKPEFLPVSDSVSFREFKSERALKAIFNGNYITSDRAWYELIQAANKGDYKIVGLPIEYFHNNPNLGLNELEWKAEVYLPVE